jgi:soluble lytic murein transglycosylase-like protein
MSSLRFRQFVVGAAACSAALTTATACSSSTAGSGGAGVVTVAVVSNPLITSQMVPLTKSVFEKQYPGITVKFATYNEGDLRDGDRGNARAMGPMQFIPETWRLYGVGANNDGGTISPDNIFDAALSAAGYLCFRGRDLATPEGWIKALRAYNLSDQYARTVRDWATAYANGHPL